MKPKGVLKGVILVAVALVMAVALFVPGCAPAAPTGGVIKVGVLHCYSGPPGAFGREGTNGFQMGVDEINAAGGVLGRTIEFTTRDTKFKPDIALSMAKELVMMEKVDILVGTMNSAGALAVSEYAKGEKVPFIVWQSQSERITGEFGHRYVFSVVPNTRIWGKSIAEFEAKQPYTKYWTGGDDYEYGHAIDNAFWRYLKQLKPEVEEMGETWWKPGEPDLAPYFTAILAAKPEAVLLCPGGASASNVWKVAKTTGLAEAVHLVIPVNMDNTVISAVGLEGAEGVLSNTNYLWYYPETRENMAYVKRFYDAYGGYPGFCAFSGYTTAYWIKAAFEKAGSVDIEKFIDAMEGLKIDSPVGKIEMRAYDHQVIAPIFVGVTKRVPEYNVIQADIIATVPGKDVMPPIEEIKKARGEL